MTRFLNWLSALTILASLLVIVQSTYTRQSLIEAHTRFGLEAEQLEKQLADVTTAPRPQTPAERTVTADSAVKANAFIDAQSADLLQRADDDRRRLLTLPELQVLYRERARVQRLNDFKLLVRHLDLTADKEDLLADAFVEWAMWNQDVDAMVRLHGLKRNDPAVDVERKKVMASFEAKMESALGPDWIKISQEYTSWERGRTIAAGYAGLLARIGHPLSLDQTERLARTYGNSDLRSITLAQWDTIEAKAQEILTPEQWEIFHTVGLRNKGSRWEKEVDEHLTRVAGPRQ